MNRRLVLLSATTFSTRSPKISPSNGGRYLDGDVVFLPTVIEAYAKIEMGSSKFVFIPFCGEHFAWDNHPEEAAL